MSYVARGAVSCDSHVTCCMLWKCEHSNYVQGGSAAYDVARLTWNVSSQVQATSVPLNPKTNQSQRSSVVMGVI